MPTEEEYEEIKNKTIDEYKNKLKEIEIITYVQIIENIKSKHNKNNSTEKENKYILNHILNGNEELYKLI